MKSSLANVSFAGINNVTIVKSHSVCLFFNDCRFVSLFTTTQNFWQIPNPIVCNLSSLPFDQNESHCHWNDEEHTYKNTHGGNGKQKPAQLIVGCIYLFCWNPCTLFLRFCWSWDFNRLWTFWWYSIYSYGNVTSKVIGNITCIDVTRNKINGILLEYFIFALQLLIFFFCCIHFLL